MITNITKSKFEEIAKGRSFKITARTANFDTIHSYYSDAINFDTPAQKRDEDGKKIALWNSSNYLELSIYKSNPATVGSAKSLFGLQYRDTVTINFNASS